MHKRIYFFVCLLTSLLSVASQGPQDGKHSALFKITQDLHKKLVAQEKPLIDFYEHHLAQLAECEGHGNSELNKFLGNIGFHKELLKKTMNQAGRAQVIEVLEEQITHLKHGLRISKPHPEIELKVKEAADCLSRLIVRHFPEHILDWTHEIPFHKKDEQEQAAHNWCMENAKNIILKSRMIERARTGWMTAVCCPCSAVLAYMAVKNRSYTIGAMAAVLTGWSGYNGYHYIRIKNLPAPTNDDVYKIWAQNIDPKLP